MSRFISNSHKKIGMSPGSLVFVGAQRQENTRIEFTQYSSNQFFSADVSDLSEMKSLEKPNNYTWINIDGLHDIELIQEIGKLYNIHSLTLEDILNTNQRPKVDDFQEYIFISLKMLWYSEMEKDYVAEQFSVCLFKDTVITFQERSGDIFDYIRKRFLIETSRLRNSGVDYLTFYFLDAIVDNYLLIAEEIADETEVYDAQLYKNISQREQNKLVFTISELKQDVKFIRKFIRPVPDIVPKLISMGSGFIAEPTMPFLKDLSDHATHAAETCEIIREILSDQLTILNTTVSNKINEVMKVLTLFSAIFIPLTFISGVYGTNFDNIPELRWQYSYFVFIGVLAVIGISTVVIFKKRKWL